LIGQATVTMKKNHCLLLGFLLGTLPSLAGQTAYDPTAVPEIFTAEVLDLTVHDAKRERDLPIRVYLPRAESPAPLLLFSHGLGGSRKGNSYLGQHWAARGYVVVFVQHPGSDSAVWEGTPRGERMAPMKAAASGQNFLLRARDIPAVLDQFELWSADTRSKLHRRVDLSRVGMSGHSFGAVTTQAASGQRFPLVGPLATDPRIKAAVMFSPSSPRRGSAKDAFGQVAIPWLLMTGTKDVAAIGDTSLESRLNVFPNLPPGSKYELVLHGAEHSAFSERALPGDKETRNPNHHRAILALSTAFWDAHLRGDRNARTWLSGDGPRSVLEESDRWQSK
jgi:predicted dienelactone hydrolase